MHEVSPHENVQESQWYALFVRSNQEKKTAQRLSITGIDHFLPCHQSVHQWKDRRVVLESPLFPGYIFVRASVPQRMKVLMFPNVVSFVGPKISPWVISAHEIAWLRRGTDEGKAEPHPYLTAGQRVVVIHGVMSGMEGILVHRKNTAWVVVALDSIARAFTVEIDASSVEPSRGYLPKQYAPDMQ